MVLGWLVMGSDNDDSSSGEGERFASVRNLRDLRLVVYADFLSGTFRDLTNDDWKMILDESSSSHYAPNSLIVEQGSDSPGICLVAEGYVRVVLKNDEGSDRMLARLAAGEIFGEMSFIEGTVTSAQVIAETDVEIVKFDADHLRRILASDHAFAARFYKSMALSFSTRLRRTNALV